MKKILIYASALLLASCGGGTADSAAEVSADTLAAPGPATATASPDSILQADATSGATAVGNRPTFNGTFVIPPQSHATVTLTMDGTVKSTTLLPGTYVRRGELLATLENPEFIALQQSYLDSHAQGEYLRTEYLRQQTLAREEAASQKKFEQSKADYLSMKSRMDAAAAQLLLLGVDTASLLAGGIVPYMEIKAPISGYVSDMQMNTGKHFSAGDPLCEIIDKSRAMLRLTAYEKDLSNLRSGDQIEFRINGMGDQTFHGVMISIGQQVDDTNRSVDAYARVDEQNPLFLPGMYVTARVKQK